MRLTSTRALALAGAVAIFAGACTGGTAATSAPASVAAPTAAASASAAESPSAAPSASAVASESAAASEAASPSAAAAAAPDRIKQAGKLVWCSDVSYAPEEFFAADGKTPQGSDIDIAAHIAQVWGVTNQVDNTSFDSIILSLTAKKCDLIISGMNDTADRQKQVDFVDYLKVGQGLLVPAGNPKGIHTLEDLSGKSVAVQKGTTNYDALVAENATLKAAGKAAINIQVFTQDTNAFQQLGLGRVDAYSTDSPVVAYYNSLPDNAGKYEIGGQPIAPAPIGIAMRKDDTGMKDAVQAVIDQMYADGSLSQILTKWGMTNAVVLLK